MAPSLRCLLLQLLTLIAFLAPLCCSASSLPSISCTFGSTTQPPSSITYFVHALNSGAPTILQAVNETAYGSFGQIAVFAYTIHEGSHFSSEKLGTIRGLEVYNSMMKDDTTILLLNTVVYKDGVYNGTVSLHGQADKSETDYELTVVGGTGSFRGVSGYAAIRNLHTSGNDHVFQHTLYFLSARSTTCPSVTV